MSKMDAAQEPASITHEFIVWHTMYLNIILILTGFNERTVQANAKKLFANNMQFKDTQQGKYKRQCVLSDEDLRSRASQWVQEMGEPNMTSPMRCEYVNNVHPRHHLFPNFHRISLRIAVCWLHQLDFQPVSPRNAYTCISNSVFF
jgi:hypothetical protein